jgi:hypothetical protein
VSCANTLDNGQECGDEGQMCDDCFQAEMKAHAYLRGLPRYMVIDDEQSREELNQELRDAGRGHLVQP